MIRFPVFPHPQRLLPIVAAVLAATSVPSTARADALRPVAAPAVPAGEGQQNTEPPATVSAEEIRGRPDQELILEREVEIIHGPTVVNADRARYDIVEDEVEAKGNIRMQRFNDVYTGDELKLQLEAEEGYLLRPTYRLDENNAQGEAERIIFEGEQRATIVDASYSTCEGPEPDWYLKSGLVRLDQGRNVGTANQTVVFFKGVPILAAPAMSFPLSSERKSGFLPPTIGTTNRGGLEVTVPYYFNIAPNRDLTVYPKIIARRGLQLGADGRYLGKSYSGQTRVEVLPEDRETGRDRYAISTTHAHTLAPGLSYGWNLNAASDRDYPSDFARTITAASQRLLPRDLSISYAPGDWSASARLSSFQVLQDPAAPIARPYDRLPQLSFAMGRQDFRGFDWRVGSELTRFSHPDMPDGDRFIVHPRLALPLVQPGYFVTPRISFHASTYRVDGDGQARHLDRFVPTFSVDSGLVLERDASLFGEAVTQTLEPRLFYVHTPYRDQSGFPNFDTAVADLSFAQLFSENRFVGNDRIGDADQLTAALVSRYIEPSGVERMRLAIGQRFHFEEQRVTLSGTVRNESRSDVLMSASGRLSPSLAVEGNVQYSQSLGSTRRANLGMRWQPGPARVLNLQYRRDEPNRLEQVDVSGQWPLAQRWYGVGRVNYSLPDSKVAEALLGFEYKADCWVFRAVGQRTPTATGVATYGFFFQLELNGLTRLGSNPLDALRTSIPGYQLINRPANP